MSSPVLPERPLSQMSGALPCVAPGIPPRPVPSAPTAAPRIPSRPADSHQNTEPIPLIPVVSNSKKRATLDPPTNPENPVSPAKKPFKYGRKPNKLIVYAIPLPKPLLNNIKNEDLVPDRFLIYTPPQPHILRPANGTKQPKKQWCRRNLQEEVHKAKTYDGKTFSCRGLHSKMTKGVLWATHRIKPTDIVFLNRVNNNEVDEIALVFPTDTHLPLPDLRAEFISQISRTQKSAARDTALSTFLLPVTLVIDTFAAIIWPFGGLLEIDAVWCYTSAKGWHASRALTKRLGARTSVFGQFGGTERDCFLSVRQDDQVDMLGRYLAEACHRRDPAMFESGGVPPTEGSCMSAIGWDPVCRSEGGMAWADEEWQRREFKDDFRSTMKQGARSWGRWCRNFEKKPEKMLKK